MPKRKEISEERIRRKIRRLQKKLEPSPPPALAETESMSPDDIDARGVAGVAARSSPPPPLPTLPDEVELEAYDLTNEDQEGLDPNILMALGEANTSTKEYGEEVHDEIEKRFNNILTDGLTNEGKEIRKKYKTPSNIVLLDAPDLNPELAGLLSESIKSRDKRLQERQQQLGTALAAVLSTMNVTVKGKLDPINITSTLSDAARLLCDLHHQDTQIRRRLITPNLEKNLVGSIEKSKRDEFLFGKNFNETVKTASALKKSASAILKTVRKTPIPQTDKTRRQENYRAPPRVPPMRPYKQGGGRYQQQGTRFQQPAPPTRPQARPRAKQPMPYKHVKQT